MRRTIVLLFGILAMACSTEGSSNNIPAPPQADAGATGADTNIPIDTNPPPAAGNMLLFADAVDSRGLPCTTNCLKVLVPGQTVELAVYYRTVTGQPLPNTLIQFNKNVPDNTAILTATNQYTTGDGKAQVGLTTFAGAQGQMAVTVSVPGDPAAGTIQFDILFSAGSSAPLQVSINYQGTANVPTYAMYLYLQQNGAPLCSAVHPDAPGLDCPAGFESDECKPKPTLEKHAIGINQLVPFDTLPGLDTAGTQNWIVQVRGPDGAAPVVYGCEQNVTVTKGETQQIAVTVTDLPLSFKGSYDTVTWMDLYTGVGGTAGDALSTFIGLFTEPGKTVLILACKNASGILGTACGFLVDGDQLESLGYVVASAADDLFIQMLKDNLGPNVYFTGESLAQLLKQIRFGSTITFTEEPSIPDTAGDGASFPSGAASEVWETASYYWKFGLNCPPDSPTCGLKTVKLSDIYNTTLQATFNAGVNSNSELWIDIHPVVMFNYGAFLNFLIQYEILPLLAGPNVTSYEGFIANLVGNQGCGSVSVCCDDFASKYSSELPSLVAPFADDICELAVYAASDYLEDTVEALGGDLQIGTIAGQPCFASDLTGDRSVDHIGSEPSPCYWDASFDTGSQAFKPDATWYSIRK